MKENYLVTGGSGYVGKILLEKLVKDENVGKIFVVDRDDLREDLKNNSKVIFIHKNLVDDWEKDVSEAVTRVVHLAWQIRTMYGKQKLQNHWNIDGSQKVFDWVRKINPKTFVHFSTVASYGAFPDNTFENVFKESDNFRVTNYLYAEEKRIAEENLQKTFGGKSGGASALGAAAPHTNIFIIRPASITGERGRERTGFGLQSALSGKIASQNFLFKIISKILQFMPGTSGWARQFVHEEDIVKAILIMCKSDKKFNKIESYNLCPVETKKSFKNYIDAKEMGEMLDKKVIYFPPFLVRVLCFFAWHFTMGKIPTSPGVWKAYAYPIVVDGSKILNDFDGFNYSFTIRKAYLGR